MLQVIAQNLVDSRMPISHDGGVTVFVLMDRPMAFAFLQSTSRLSVESSCDKYRFIENPSSLALGGFSYAPTEGWLPTVGTDAQGGSRSVSQIGREAGLPGVSCVGIRSVELEGFGLIILSRSRSGSVLTVWGSVVKSCNF